VDEHRHVWVAGNASSDENYFISCWRCDCGAMQFSKENKPMNEDDIKDLTSILPIGGGREIYGRDTTTVTFPEWAGNVDNVFDKPCTVCGALATDMTLHMDWHEKQARIHELLQELIG